MNYKKEGLKQLSWVKDYESFFENAIKDFEKQKNIVDNNKNIDNNEIKDNPQSKEQMDNRQNFNKGLSTNQDNQSL